MHNFLPCYRPASPAFKVSTVSDLKYAVIRDCSSTVSCRRRLVYHCASLLHPDSSSESPQWYQPSSATREDFLALWRQKRPDLDNTMLGTVYLVGTGPGDPGLLTLRAASLLNTADVVLYDRLVSKDVLRLIGPSALAIYVGKQKGFHTRTQEEIQELLGAFATSGATVVRLKGGDPFIFGRGGEEANHLASLGITVKVVPGITAASGISAELGIPLTHRGVATSVRFLTGHSREGGEDELDETVSTVCDPHTTLVVYMGLGTLPSLAKKLLMGGLSRDTPAVAIERGTTPEQRIVYATLESLEIEVARHNLQSPTLIVIGRCVALSQGWSRCQQALSSLDVGTDNEAWFDKKELRVYN